MLFQNRGGGRHLTVCIYQDGALIRSVSLDTVSKPCEIKVTGRDGAYNIIEIRPDSVGVTDASCPDKLCVHMGFQRSGILPITCLPNRVVVQLVDAGASLDGSAY